MISAAFFELSKLREKKKAKK